MEIFIAHILECLDDFDVGFLIASPELDAISPHRCQNLLVEKQFVVHWQLRMTSREPIHLSGFEAQLLSFLLHMWFLPYFCFVGMLNCLLVGYYWYVVILLVGEVDVTRLSLI